MFSCTGRYTHKTFPMFKLWKTVFIYINIFLSDPPLIKTPSLLITDTFVGPRVTIQTPLPSDLSNTVKNMFFKIGVFLVITGCEKKKQNFRILVWCARVAVCGRLLVVSVRLLVVYSRLFVICGGLWSFAGGFWSFVVVYGRSLF